MIACEWSLANDVCPCTWHLKSREASRWRKVCGAGDGYTGATRSVCEHTEVQTVTREPKRTDGGASDANATVTRLGGGRTPPVAQSGRRDGRIRGAKKRAAGSEPRDRYPAPRENKDGLGAFLAPELGSSILGSGNVRGAVWRETHER